MFVITRLKTFLTFVFCIVTLLATQNIWAYQSKTDIAKLRKLFTKAVGQDFEIVRDILNHRPAARGGETYWLVHVKPKRTGHFALTYTYKYTHKFTHPEEGENELIIRVGGKNCSRYNNDNSGLSNVCLGDTIIVPIRTDNVSRHQFNFKSTYLDGESIGKAGQNSIITSDISNAEQVKNPLENNLKYLGTQRYVSPHRNFGAATINYTAFFEAKNIGRFNLGLSTGSGDENADKLIKMNPLDALPVIIISPKTPITALVYQENTINYSDNKRFSGHASNYF